MLFTCWYRSANHKIRHSRRRLTPDVRLRKCRPQVERLEGRELPAALLGLVAFPDQNSSVTEKNTLVRFNSEADDLSNPEEPRISNLTLELITVPDNDTILAIDFRPKTGQLYGISSQFLYLLRMSGPASWEATRVNAQAFPAGTLPDQQVSFDFDPVQDQIRVGVGIKNLRLNPTNGQVIAQDPNFTMPGNNGFFGLGDFAHSNNLGGNASLLGLVTAVDDILVRVNGGTGVVNAIDFLGFNSTDFPAFDIGARNDLAFAAVPRSAQRGFELWHINVSLQGTPSSRSTLIGKFADTFLHLDDLAVVRGPDPIISPPPPPPAPVPPMQGDVTAVVMAFRFRLRRHPVTGRYRQMIMLWNTSNQAIQGPLLLVLDRLPRQIQLLRKAGLTRAWPPFRSPYLSVNLGADFLLQPNEMVTLWLDFANPTGQRPKFQIRLLAGPGLR